MIQQSKATIFLAEERGLKENGSFRSLQTLHSGNHFNEHKGRVGDIYVMNDDTLDGGCSLNMLVQEYSYIILLPVVGAIHYKDSLGNENLLAAGQVQMLNPGKGVRIEISNPFKEELVNFLQVWIKAGPVPAPAISFLSTYNVNEQPDNLVRLPPARTNEPALPVIASIGKFKGRGETVYELQHNKSIILVFVLEGAFEVEGRLLHARDGLALWETKSVEMEALSNDAIVLLIETTGNE